MSAGKKEHRLESNIEQLNEIINTLVEENHMLKVLLQQYQGTTSNGQKRKKN